MKKLSKTKLDYASNTEHISFDILKGARERYKLIAKSCGLKLGQFFITAAEEYIRNHELDTLETTGWKDTRDLNLVSFYSDGNNLKELDENSAYMKTQGICGMDWVFITKDKDNDSPEIIGCPIAFPPTHGAAHEIMMEEIAKREKEVIDYRDHLFAIVDRGSTDGLRNPYHLNSQQVKPTVPTNSNEPINSPVDFSDKELKHVNVTDLDEDNPIKVLLRKMIKEELQNQVKEVVAEELNDKPEE